MSSDYFNEIIDHNGPLSMARAVSTEIVSSYRDKLPGLLIEIWQKHGVGSWAGGLFALCVPNDFAGLLSQVFRADRDLQHTHCHVVGYSAFGTLLVWSERHGLVRVLLSRGEITAEGITHGDVNYRPEDELAVFLFGLTDNKSLDPYDDNGRKLFARAVKKLGRPDPGEAFGFAPALAMGGAPNLKNIKVVPALEHFSFLAQLQRFQLVDYLARPARVVRPIG